MHKKKDYKFFGRNGYAILEFAERRLAIQYFDAHTMDAPESELLLEEEWKIGADGTLTRLKVRQYCKDDDFYGPERWGSESTW